MIQLESVESPLDRGGAALAAAQALGRADAMGLLDEKEPIRHLDLTSLRRLVSEVARSSGAGRDIVGAIAAARPSAEQVTAAMRRLYDELEQSPVPRREWRSLIGTLGYELLTALVGVSEVSARRYAAGERATPDDVAERLHYLALVVADLSGSYNELGVRRWFQRQRPQLDGKSPALLLRGRWRSDSGAAQRVRDLARSLTGPLAT